MDRTKELAIKLVKSLPCYSLIAFLVMTIGSAIFPVLVIAQTVTFFILIVSVLLYIHYNVFKDNDADEGAYFMMFCLLVVALVILYFAHGISHWTSGCIREIAIATTHAIKVTFLFVYHCVVNFFNHAIFGPVE